jgi:hypothetical protein
MTQDTFLSHFKTLQGDTNEPVIDLRRMGRLKIGIHEIPPFATLVRDDRCWVVTTAGTAFS